MGIYRIARVASWLSFFAALSASATLQYDGYNCKAQHNSFPSQAFNSQPDDTRVYLKVSNVGRSSLTQAGLVKFASVFGVRVVGDRDVSSSKIVYVATVLAELLDLNENGRPINMNLVRALRKQHSMIVLLSTTSKLKELSMRRNRPQELKCFSRAFHVAPAKAVKSDRSREQICPQDGAKKDRTKGLVGDFIVSKGYPATYPSDAAIGQKMKQFFEKAKTNKWINTDASKCRTTACQEIAFQSWALSSAMGSDKCWCETADEWRFCSPESMKRGFPELWGTLAQELILRGETQPNGRYRSRALAY